MVKDQGIEKNKNKARLFLSKTVNQHKTQPKIQMHQCKWNSIWLWAGLRSQTKHSITVSCSQQNIQKLIFTWKSFIICRCLVCKQYKTEILESLLSHEEVQLPHMHLSQPVNNCSVIMVDISAAPVPSARFKLEMFWALQHAPLHPRFYSHSFLLPPPLRKATCQPFS